MTKNDKSIFLTKAKGAMSHEVLFAAFAKAAERRMGDFKAKELANTAWAFVTVGHRALGCKALYGIGEGGRAAYS